LGNKARIVLEDGYSLTGRSFGAPISAAGEVVFTTGMVGYPESLTDPSYQGQILTLTFPSIGNYGVPGDGAGEFGLPAAMESDRIQVAGLVVADYSPAYSHWEAVQSLSAWLREHGVPAICDVDTRALTQRLRERGTMLGKLEVDGDPGWFDPATENLVARVGRGREGTINPGPEPRLAVIDCGCKNNILRCLARRGASLEVLPWDADPADVEHDGLVLTNGPGDPVTCEATIRHVAAALQRDVPVFGVCLGCQLLALASGASTFKLRYGHRGQNQPVIDTKTRRCYVTSQNHGYAVDSRTLPDDWEVWFLNANDGTVEGIRHRSKPVSAVQFHPEASCGPVDTAFLFDRFLEQVHTYREGR